MYVLLLSYEDSGSEKIYATKLMKAVKEGHKDIVKQLLDDNTNINTKNRFGDTALMNAVRASNKEMVQFLLENNADTEILYGTYPYKHNYRYKALTVAIELGNTEITRLLIENGADTDGYRANGYGDFSDPAVTASESGNPELAQLISEDINEKLMQAAKDRDIKLMQAVKRNRGDRSLSLVKELIAQGADIYAKDKDGDTALIVAHKEGSERMYALLLSYEDSDSEKIYATKLMKAVKEGHKDIVKQLLDDNTNINTKDRSGNTALMNAVRASNKEMVQFLLENNADT